MTTQQHVDISSFCQSTPKTF